MALELVNFSCGSLPRDIDVAEFFRTEESIDLVESGDLRAWLYYDAEKNLVGVSSLGMTNWHYPKPSDDKVPIQIIPNLAVALAHQGSGYAKEILDDTISEAVSRVEKSDLLALFVHVDNSAAIGLYKSRNFDNFGKPMKRSDGAYQRMLLLL